MRRSTVSMIAASLLATAIYGCSSGEQSGEIQLALAGTDQSQLFTFTPQTQPTSNDVVSAVVTIKEIDAHANGNWVPVSTTPLTVDLLKLDNKNLTTLGIVKLPTGHIDELRLVLDEIGDYVVLKDGTKKPLEVPDNGIVKIEGKLDLDSCAAGIVILDFDPKIKIETEGSRTEYELTCNAHIKTEEIKGACGVDMAGKGSVDMAHAPGADMAGSCSNVVCPSPQVCVDGQCVADCTSVVCPTGQTCESQNGMPVCVPITDMSHAGSPDMSQAPMDGGCHKH
jgi:hypothetical protein